MLNQALALYNDLMSKDLRIKNCEAYADDQDFEEQLIDKVNNRLDPIDADLIEMTNEGINNIKMMVVVALIYEISRNFPVELKPVLKDYF